MPRSPSLYLGLNGLAAGVALGLASVFVSGLAEPHPAIAIAALLGLLATAPLALRRRRLAA